MLGLALGLAIAYSGVADLNPDGVHISIPGALLGPSRVKGSISLPAGAKVSGPTAHPTATPQPVPAPGRA